MATIGADLEFGKIHVDPYGRTWCAGWSAGTVYVEASDRRDLQTVGIFGIAHRKAITTADQQQPSLVVEHSGAVLVELKQGDALEHWRLSNYAGVAERIDTT